MAKAEDIERKYEEYARKYSLPDLMDIQKHFGIIDDLQNTREIPVSFLSFIRRRIVESLSGWTGYFHSLLVPNQQNMIVMHEFSNFSDEEKEEITQIVNKLMWHSRVSTKLELVRSEEADAKFITEALSSWKGMNKQMTKITEKNIKIWHDSLSGKRIKEKPGAYLG
jgi:hypothetical protein